MALKLANVHDRPTAANILWALLHERGESESISHQTVPSWDEHRAFVEGHPYRAWCFLTDGDQTVGAVYATHRNEVGVQVFFAHRRKGYARAGLRLLMDQIAPLDAIPALRPGHWVANINPRNRKSVALFKSLGFEHVQDTYALRHS